MNKMQTVHIISDRLIHLVVNKRRMSPPVVGLLSAIILILYFAILALIFGEFKSHDGTIGFLEDYNLFNNFLLGVAPVVAFYFLVPEYIQQCFEKLSAKKVFTSAKSPPDRDILPYKDMDHFLASVKTSLSSKWWIVIGMALSTAFMAIIIPEHFKAKHWIVKYWLSLVTIEIIWWILFSLTIILVLRVLVGIWWINQSFKSFHVMVRPLYPDKVGGLQPLSEFSLRLGYIIFFFGLELGLNQYFTGYKVTGELGQLAWSADIILVWVVYILLAPLAFFAPISAAHDAMQEAKNNEILLISSHFEKEYQALRDNLGKPVSSLKTHSSKIEELQKLYALANAFPVWPFEVKKFAQFSATILSPLMLTILSSLVTAWLTSIWRSP